MESLAEGALGGVVTSPADFTRKIDHVAMPKCDRLSDGLANWNAIILTFTAAPLATADVVARNGRRNRDEHRHGRCGEKRGSGDALRFHSSPLKVPSDGLVNPSYQRPCEAFGMELVQQLLEGFFSRLTGRRHRREKSRRLLDRDKSPTSTASEGAPCASRQLNNRFGRGALSYREHMRGGSLPPAAQALYLLIQRRVGARPTASRPLATLSAPR
jgi:hypothetical protein